jgi:chromosome segregation ATPase
MFRGASYQSSFFLIFNKGQKNQKQLLNSMRKMEIEMRAGSEKEKNPLIAEGYKKIEAILSIFNHSGNVIPFSPYDTKSRSVLLEMINNSPPIAKDALGCAVDSKNSQQLNKILCDIAGNAKKHVEDIQESNDSLNSLIRELNAELNLVKDLQKNILDEEGKIKKENEKIEEQEVGMKNHKQSIEDEEEIIKGHDMKVQVEHDAIKEKQKFIDEEDERKKQGLDFIVNESENLEREYKIIKDQDEIILKNKEEILKSENLIVGELQKIKTEEYKIQANEETISANLNMINNSSALDYHHAIRAKINLLDSAKQSVGCQQNMIDREQSKVSSFQGRLNYLNSRSQILIIGNESYSESALYPNAKKGTVNNSGHRLSLSNSIPIAKYEKDGKLYCSEGSNGYFSSEEQGALKYSVVYYGPSHSFGWASIRIYAEERNTEEAKNKKIEIERDLAKWKGKLSSAQSSYNTASSEKSTALSNYNSQVGSTRSSLESDNVNRRGRIANSNNLITSSNNVINSNNASILNCKNTIATVEGVISNLKNSISDLENSKATVKTAIEASRNMIQSYRNAINIANNAITSSKDAIANSKCLINTAKDSIKNCSSSIDNCNSLIESFENSIDIFNSNVSNANTKLSKMKVTVGDLSGTIDKSEVILDMMEKANKFKMLSTVCGIMGLKLEVVYEFEKLYPELPGLLVNSKKVLQEIQGLLV